MQLWGSLPESGRPGPSSAGIDTRFGLVTGALRLSVVQKHHVRDNNYDLKLWKNGDFSMPLVTRDELNPRKQRAVVLQYSRGILVRGACDAFRGHPFVFSIHPSFCMSIF